MYVFTGADGSAGILYTLKGVEAADYFEIEEIPQKPEGHWELMSAPSSRSVYWKEVAFDLEHIRSQKRSEISVACNIAILAGVDVDTTQGAEHFAMQETDQINMQLATAAVQAGASGYPYHADGKLCRIFTAAEIKAVGDAMIAHKMYHTTYCNHMFEWIRRAEGEELQGIQYGAQLPDDLQASMEAVLTDAANM